MIIRGPNFQIISRNSNTEYYSGGFYPEWTPIAGIHDFPVRRKGEGVEPHYHDNDEFWFWATGRGEVWLDGKNMPVGPNTAVYTPMGVVHKFLMHTDFEVVAVITRLERKRRARHILVEEDGTPEPTVPGFIVPGAANNGPFPDRGPRCPVSELRLVHLAAGKEIKEAALAVNEHWVVLSGAVYLSVDGREAEMFQSDLALLRAGAVRRLRAPSDARLVLVRE